LAKLYRLSQTSGAALGNGAVESNRGDTSDMPCISQESPGMAEFCGLTSPEATKSRSRENKILFRASDTFVRQQPFPHGGPKWRIGERHGGGAAQGRGLRDSGFVAASRERIVDDAEFPLHVSRGQFFGVGMRIIASVLSIAALLAATPGAARERLLTPTEEWRVNSADESCVLIRNFGDPAIDGVRLQMRSFRPGDHFKITMVGEGLPLREGRLRGVAKFKYRFKPDREWREAFGATGYVDGVDALTFQSDLATRDEAEQRQRLSPEELERAPDAWEATLARAAEVEQLALAYPTRDDTVLQLGSMAEPLVKLRECTRNVMRGWGYDPVAIDSFQMGPKLLNPREIGSALLGRFVRNGVGHNSPLNFRLDIDEHGSATGCTVQHPRRGNEAEALICQTLLDKAEFEPARDAAGNPVRAPFVSSVAFGIG
jgi:hypothetical protein